MKKVTINNMPELPYAVEEAVNRLRVNISFLGKDIRKIMLISTMPDEGKSFVTMQLWRQMVETGNKSVLVDVDMRKSVTAEKYEIELPDGEKLKGTSHYLSGDYPLSEAVYQTQWENGDILLNVDNVVNPAMLLESKRFKDMLDELAEEYRYVFVDSPPLNLVSDGERVGNLCDGAILIVRGGITSKHYIKNSIRQLERAGCPLLGIVLNRVEGAKSGYYYKRYGSKYYGYGKYYRNNYTDAYYGSK